MRAQLGRGSELLPRSGFSRRKNPERIIVGRTVTIPGSCWMNHLGVFVISSLDRAASPTGSGEIIDQWHLSASAGFNNGVRRRERRITADELRSVLEAWSIDQFEIDNHEPGIATHIWLPCKLEHRVECECKTDELIVVEPDGHTWTTPKNGPCRGCEYRVMAAAAGADRQCPIHPEVGEPTATIKEQS